MAIIKCKMCGGDLNLVEGSTVAECEYCGSKQTVPTADSEKKMNLFARANRLRANNEFDKAAGVYESIVADFPEEAEAYWGLILCKFGIEYVDDPATGKKIPTCHRSSFDSLMDDSNFELVMENAEPVARRVYREEAKQIEELRKRIIEVSSHEEPYDIFICYKETDDNGQRTLDSVLAQDVYDMLTENGYRVFFSRVTLEDKLGVEYEPYIFAALNSAKIMLAFGTDYDYYNAVWVKNEWSRFLQLIARGEKKTLIPCYKNIDAYDMPKEFAKLQAQDLGKVGAMQDLLRGIKKILPKEQTVEPAARPLMQQVIQSSGPSVDAMLKRGRQALEDRDWKAATEFFDKALDLDAENGEAFFGKALAAAHCTAGEELPGKRIAIPVTKTEQLTACERDLARIARVIKKNALPGYLKEEEIRACFTFDDRTYSSLTAAWQARIAEEAPYWERDRLMSRAVRYAGDDLSRTLQTLRQKVETGLQARLDQSKADDASNKKETAERFAARMNEAERRAKQLRAEAEAKRQKDYEAACSMQEKAANDYHFSTVAEEFESDRLRGYRDSDERAGQCRAEYTRLREEKKQKKEKAEAEAQKRRKKNTIIGIIAAALAVLAIAAVIIVTTVIIPNNRYNAAVKLYEDGKYEEAIAAFEAMHGYKDSADRKLGASYQIAVRLYEDGKYEKAIAAFESLDGYKDSADQIEKCQTAILDQKYDAAVQLYENGKYKEAIAAFEALDGYKDAQNRAFEARGAFVHWETVSAGGVHTVGLKSDGTVVAVGYNYQGQCDVGDWTNIVGISAGAGHTIGLKSDGTVVAVGYNEDGQCDVGDWRDIVAISASLLTTVGLKSDGTVVAAGVSGYTKVGGWRDVVAISAGSYHTVGLKSDGTVVAVGANNEGQCDVGGWEDVVSITAGSVHTVGLKSDGTVVAVGDNDHGQCDVINWRDVVAISAYGSHTVGLKSDGTAVAVGDNDHGQCDVGDWRDIVAISAGGGYTVGLKSDGTVVAVGDNDHGQCDVGNWTSIKLPNQ